MSGKVKMRCARCGKTYKAEGGKQVLCSECIVKERAVRATRTAAPVADARTVPVAAPRIVGPGAAILVPELARSAPAVETARVDAHPAPAAAARATVAANGSTPPRVKGQRPIPQPRAARKPPVPTFLMTDDLRARIEERYLELARPIEFDGIRARIAEELGVPKCEVKKVVQQVRTSRELPSWWELRAFTGTPDDLERVRARYAPLLPVPPVGVHRLLADDLGMDPGQVYQAIRRVRAELQMPRFNAREAHTHPDTHPEEIAQVAN